MKGNKKILFIITILFIFILFIIPNKTDDESINIKFTKEILIDRIINSISNNEIDKSFLSWIYDNYHKKALLELDNYLKNGTYSIKTWHDITGNSYIVLRDLYNNKYVSKDNIKIINDSNGIISFIGDVSLADNWYIMPKYDERGKGISGIIDDELINIMKSSSIMVANSEFTVSKRGEKMPGKYYTFKGNPQRLSIYEEMGVDLITLANNHVYDFGR